MDSDKPSQKAGGEAAAKKTYRKPEILYREPLEAMAALCTPAPPSKTNAGVCPGGPVQS